MTLFDTSPMTFSIDVQR